VKTRVDPRLREEAERFELRFTCEHCVHFEPERSGCAHGYPTAPHRGVVLALEREIEFCKEFELV